MLLSVTADSRALNTACRLREAAKYRQAVLLVDDALGPHWARAAVKDQPLISVDERGLLL